jgi:asparagine synthetase A
METEIRCKHSDAVDPTTLVPHPRNPNEHSDREIELLSRILPHQGWRSPIVVSKRSGFVICGHGRLKAALAIGCDLVPVDVQDFEDEATEFAHMIADNRLSELSEFNYENVAGIFKDVAATGMDLDLTGFLDFERSPFLQAKWEPETLKDLEEYKNLPPAKALKLTEEQIEVFNRAAARVRKVCGKNSMSDGQVVELLSAEYLAGA